MALGPDNFNFTISLGSIFVFQGDDIDDLFDSDSEPYLWVFMIKIDGEGLRQQGNFLAGAPTFFFSPGSHGNIGGSIEHGTRKIPANIGTWESSLKPIPISVAGQQLTAIPGTVLVAAVLMEENLTPNSAVEAAHQSVINLIKNTANSTIASLGLAGIAADAVVEVATDAANGITTSLEIAAQRILTRRLKPIRDLFTIAAPANATVTILQNLDLGGFLGTAIDRDKPLGTFNQVFSQADLAGTTDHNSYGGTRSVEILEHMWNMPEWAFTLHGEAFAHHKYVRRATPTTPRLQVTSSSKRFLIDGPRVTGIGGVDGGIFWALGRQEAAIAINEGRHTFFVRGANGREVDVHSVQGGFEHGRPWFFLQTSADQDKTNNLNKLPNSPPGGDLNEIWF